MTKLYAHREMQLLMSGSKSGKIKKKKKKNPMQQLTCQLRFSLITPLPRWKKRKNVNLAPLEVCAVKGALPQEGKKITGAGIKRGAEVWTFINKKFLSSQRVLMRRAVDVAFMAGNIVPLKELRGACVCD